MSIERAAPGCWVGVPFRLGGRDRERGLDCLGLLIQRLGAAGLFIEDPWAAIVSDFAAGTLDMDAQRPPRWTFVRVGEEREGDVVVLRERGHPTHVGYLEDGGLVLHTSRATGSILTRLSDLRRAGSVHAIWRPQP